MENSFYKIESYLDGEMSETERSVFELSLSNNPELRQQFEEVKAIRKTLTEAWQEEATAAALSKNLEAIGRPYFGKSSSAAEDSVSNDENQVAGKFSDSKSKKSPNRFLFLAAAVVLLLAFFLFFPKKSDNDLYAQYREFPTASFTLRGGSDLTLAEAERAFNSGDYAAALPIFEALIREKPQDSELRFFTSLTCLEAGNIPKAVDLLKILSAESNAWGGEALWYLALAHLKNKNFDEAKDILRTISPADGHYLSGQEILKKLEK